MSENPSAPVGHGSPAKSAGGLMKNKKVAIGFGIFLVLGIVFVAIHSANKNANSAQQSAGQSAVDPATGYPFGSMADSNALGGGFFPGGSGSGSEGSTAPPVSVTVNYPPGTTPSTQPQPTGKPPVHKPPAHHNPPPHHHSNTYVVKPGDSLSEIASRFHVSGGWHTLYSLNKHTIGGNPNLIHPGQKLTL